MVKEGPCYHCGIENTPLWRNGPREKPVLCNACGSRWRTRGTLHDYVPKHAMKEIFISQIDVLPTKGMGDYHNWPSSSQNDINLTNTDGLKECIPRRRRSTNGQVILSPVERFHKQLYDIAHEKPGVFLKELAVEDVLIDPGNMMSTPPETLLGAMLLSPPERELAESVSSSNAKVTNAFALAKNCGDQGESSTT